MSKATDLATPQQGSLLTAGVEEADAAIAAIQPEDGELDFLAQFRFFTANSGFCQNEEVPPNTYGMLVDGDVEPIGKTMEIFVCRMRYRASQDIDGEVYVDFDPTSEFSKEAHAKSEDGDMGCMAGPELLVYVPEFGFGTLLMGSKSNRRTARTRFKNCIGKTYKCDQRKATSKKNGKSWQAMKIVRSKEPLTEEDLPQDELKRALALFNKKEAKLPTDAPDDDRS